MSSTFFMMLRSFAKGSIGFGEKRRQLVKIAGIEPGLGKVGRRENLLALLGLPEQLPQRAGVGRGQSLRRLLGVRPRAVGQSDPQPSVRDQANDLQRMGAVAARAPAGAGGWGSPEERALPGGGIGLAKVVEADLSRRGRFQAQQAVTDAATRHGAQPLLGAHQGLAGLRVSLLQDDRVLGGEPAHGAR